MKEYTVTGTIEHGGYTLPTEVIVESHDESSAKSDAESRVEDNLILYSSGAETDGEVTEDTLNEWTVNVIVEYGGHILNTEETTDAYNEEEAQSYAIEKVRDNLLINAELAELEDDED